MSSMSSPQPHSPWNAIGDLLRRVQALERNPEAIAAAAAAFRPAYIIVPATVSSLASGGSGISVDLSSSSITTNDGVSGPTRQADIASPFVGLNYTADWAADATHIRITGRGLFWVHTFIDVQSFSGFPAAGQQVIWGLSTEQTGGSGLPAGSFGLASDPLDNVETKVRSDTGLFTSDRVSRHDELIIRDYDTVGPTTVGQLVYQFSPWTITSADAGISIIKIGDLAPL